MFGESFLNSSFDELSCSFGGGPGFGIDPDPFFLLYQGLVSLNGRLPGVGTLSAVLRCDRQSHAVLVKTRSFW